MDTIEYRTIDKSAWPRGERDDEPDKVQWPDEATGLPCLAVRHPELGHWCGYVGVAPGHPLYGIDYGEPIDPAERARCAEEDGTSAWEFDRPESVLDAHGGITFAGKCTDGADPSRHVCHIAAPGEPDHVWWFGFDCMHYGDLSPTHGLISAGEAYRSLSYVRREVARLARQIADYPNIRRDGDDDE